MFVETLAAFFGVQWTPMLKRRNVAHVGMSTRSAQTFAPPGAGVVCVRFYKHSAPLGPGNFCADLPTPRSALLGSQAESLPPGPLRTGLAGFLASGSSLF
jgi:hypothetical protein